ncbi:MAG: Holliday junction branch migration protein RuvA [Verrucomicrobiae bacterium]|nr:Holliday junction branch migration protein RuvA [Verrucomicrobiae bacterium]
MITFLRGKLVEAHPTHAVVDVGGVGYQVAIPLSSFGKLPAPETEVFLHTELVIREDAHLLFGFATLQERSLFRMLIEKVSGIGPKTAMAVLSGMNAGTFAQAVSAGDVKLLSAIPGVGKKTAERIVVELRDKLGDLPTGASSPVSSGTAAVDLGEARLNDAVLALGALGYKPLESHQCVRTLISDPKNAKAGVEDLVRLALKQMN